MIVLTSYDHVGRPADDLSTRCPRHTLTLVVVLAEILLHVIPGDVDHDFHVPDTGLWVHEFGQRRCHGVVVHPVAITPKVHGQRVRSLTREHGRFTLDHVRVDGFLEEYRQLYRRVKTGRRHRMHERFATRQIRPFVSVTAAARFRWQPDAHCKQFHWNNM